MDAIREFLVQCRLGQRLDVLLPHLQGLGVEGLEDLLDVEREDLKGAGEPGGTGEGEIYPKEGFRLGYFDSTRAGRFDQIISS